MFYKPEDLNFDSLMDDYLDISLLNSKKEEEWNKHIESIMKANSKIRKLNDNDSLMQGDIIKINIKSEAQRFNKENLIITLGIGIYCLDLEKQLIGMKLYQKGNIQFKYKDSDIIAQVEILSGERNELPNIDNDDIMQFIKDEAVSTLSEYKKKWCNNWFAASVQDEFISKLYMKLIGELVKASDITLKNESIEKEQELYKEWEINELPKYDNKLEYYKAIFGDSVMDENDGNDRVNAHIKAKAGLREYSNKLAEIDNLVISYENYIKEVEAYATEQNVQKEEVMNMITFENYKESLITENVSKKLFKVLSIYLKNKGVEYGY